MKKFLLSTVAAMALPAVGGAADMPLKIPMALAPVSTWTGFYIGGNAGAALYESSVDYSGPQGWDTFFTSNPLQTSKVGGTIGGQFGYNYQIRSFVLGFEGDGAWMGGLSRSKVGGWSDCPSTGCLVNAQTNATGFASIRVRAGVDVSNGTLLYGTAGWGWVNINNTVNVTGSGSPGVGVPNKGGNFVANKWAPAFVVGGGIEQMIDTHWSVRAELLFAKIEDQSAGPADTHYFGSRPVSPVPPVNYTSSVTLGRLGINYKF